MGRKVIDSLILAFFFISIFYFVKNILFSKHNLKTLNTYRINIEDLKKILAKEKAKKDILEKEYAILQDLRKENLESYIRDYLFMVQPDEQIYLKRK